jgi:hypothetical protein
MTATATSPKQGPVSLDEVLHYRHEGVINRYRKDHGASRAEAEELFGEMLKWLYLCYRSKIDGADDVICAMNPEIEKIDWMWHCFILFTWDYAQFCQHYFGFFLHHFPTMDGEPTAVDEATFRSRTEMFYSFLYDVLGEQTLITWFDEGRFAAKA